MVPSKGASNGDWHNQTDRAGQGLWFHRDGSGQDWFFHRSSVQGRFDDLNEGQRVSFDVDHDDVLAVLATQQRMPNTRRRTAGGVDHDVDMGRGADQLRVLRLAYEEFLAAFEATHRLIERGYVNIGAA